MAIVLGAGGSARAVVYALCNDSWDVTISARRIEQAKQLSQYFGKYDLRLSTFDFQPSTFDLIVNTTPLGMTPNIEISPLPEDAILSKHTFIYDLVYNPRETKLVKDARAQGCSAVTGLGMLIEQAALAFEIWTGAKADRDAMQKAVA